MICRGDMTLAFFSLTCQNYLCLEAAVEVVGQLTI